MSAYPAVTLSSATTSAPVAILPAVTAYNTAPGSYSLGIIVTLSSGANLTYSVEVTADQNPVATGHWNTHDNFNGLTVSANGNVAYPITGMRLKVTAHTSGTVNMGIAQWP